MLLGYGAERKGYRLYDLKCKRIMYSLDVLFDEFRWRIDKAAGGKEEKYEMQHIGFDCWDPVVPEAKSDDEIAEPVLRRSGRDRTAGDYFCEWATISSCEPTEPRTVKEALVSPDKDKWVAGMQKEIDSLNSNDKWDLVEMPKERKAVGSK